MGKISQLRLHVAPAQRDWRTEGIRPEELELLYRGVGSRQELPVAAPNRPSDQPDMRKERRDA